MVRKPSPTELRGLVLFVGVAILPYAAGLWLGRSMQRFRTEAMRDTFGRTMAAKMEVGATWYKGGTLRKEMTSRGWEGRSHIVFEAVCSEESYLQWVDSRGPNYFWAVNHIWWLWSPFFLSSQSESGEMQAEDFAHVLREIPAELVPKNVSRWDAFAIYPEGGISLGKPFDMEPTPPIEKYPIIVFKNSSMTGDPRFDSRSLDEARIFVAVGPKEGSPKRVKLLVDYFK